MKLNTTEKKVCWKRKILKKKGLKALTLFSSYILVGPLTSNLCIKLKLLLETFYLCLTAWIFFMEKNGNLFNDSLLQSKLHNFETFTRKTSAHLKVFILKTNSLTAAFSLRRFNYCKAN